MNKCARHECDYQVHSKLCETIGQFCCNSCKTNGTHGPLCKQTKVLLPENRFDTIHSFALDKDQYLFMDIFHKNKELIILCPSNTTSILSHITVYSEQAPIQFKQKIPKLGHHKLIVLIYSFDPTKEENDVTVAYKGKVRRFSLFHMQTTKSNTLCVAGLFKNDFKLMNVFHTYYTNQGAEFFFMYYNGIMKEPITQLCRKKRNLKLLEWNFQYWDKDCGCKQILHNHICEVSRYAQIGYMQHALYKYAKQDYAYIAYCDLNEYMNLPNMRLLDYVTNNAYDVIGFHKVWARTIDQFIPAKTFPNILCISDSYHVYGSGSKHIYKANAIEYTSLYAIEPNAELDLKKYSYSIHNAMFCFPNWIQTKDMPHSPTPHLFNVHTQFVDFKQTKFSIQSIRKTTCIPNHILFVFGLKPQEEEFLFCYYLAVYSAFLINKPNAIYFFFHYRPYGKWFDKLKEDIPCIKFIRIPMPTHIGKKELIQTAHKADIVRMKKLFDLGGVYMDIDTISIRPYTHLLENEVVLGYQTKDRICNAIMMTSSKSSFFAIWLQLYEQAFRPGGWEESSILLPFTLSETYPTLVNVVPKETFFKPCWDNTDKIFAKPAPIPPELITLHLWESCSREYIPAIQDWSWADSHSFTMYGKIMLQLKQMIPS